MTQASYTIDPRVVAVDESHTVGDAVLLLKEKGISSLLVTNTKGMVTGILTERDLVRKFTLLDVADKLVRPIATVASRDVHFADFDNLHASIVKLHFERGFRHFPVLKGKEHKLDNVVGMLTITDLLRHYLRDEAERATKNQASSKNPLPKHVAVLTARPALFEPYREALTRATLSPARIADVARFVTDHPTGTTPLVVDLDGWKSETLSSVIVQAKKYKGVLVMTVSNPDVVTLFRKFLARGRQTIAAKPFDADYLVWLLTEKDRRAELTRDE